MVEVQDWRAVYDFWFPPGLEAATAEAHHQRFQWWFGGGANAELARFAPVVEAARAGRLDHWARTPRGRVALLIVLDQLTRGLFAGSPPAYASDPQALGIAEEGLRNGHYDELMWPWEKTTLLLAMAHAEGPDHRQRLERVAALAQAIASEAPSHLQPLYQFSAAQARAHLEVIARFGRFPHRNAVLGRASTPEEAAYIATGELVHLRRPPELARAA